jgi:hypothetical protein
LGLAFVLVPLSMANTPANDTSLGMGTKGLTKSLFEITITQTDSLAKAGIDTAAVSVANIRWDTAGDAATAVTHIHVLNDAAAGDSVSVVLQASVDGTVWVEDVAAFVLNGQVGVEKDPAILAPYWRFIVTNNDDVKHPYTLRVIALREP